MTDPDPGRRHGRMRRLVRGWTVAALGTATLAAGGLTLALAHEAQADDTTSTVVQDGSTTITDDNTSSDGTGSDGTSSDGTSSDGTSSDSTVTGGEAPRAGSGSSDTGSGGS